MSRRTGQGKASGRSRGFAVAILLGMVASCTMLAAGFVFARHQVRLLSGLDEGSPRGGSGALAPGVDGPLNSVAAPNSQPASNERLPLHSQVGQEIQAPELLGAAVSGWSLGADVDRAITASEARVAPHALLSRRSPTELSSLLRASPDAWTRADALEQLARMHDDDCLPAIRDALSDSERDVRREAVDALAEMGDPLAVRFLRAAWAREPDAEVRAEIRAAIDELRER